VKAPSKNKQASKKPARRSQQHQQQRVERWSG